MPLRALLRLALVLSVLTVLLAVVVVYTGCAVVWALTVTPRLWLATAAWPTFERAFLLGVLTTWACHTVCVAVTGLRSFPGAVREVLTEARRGRCGA